MKSNFPEENVQNRIFKRSINELSNAELLAMILGDETNEMIFQENIKKSRKILKRYGSYENLREATSDELCGYEGVNKVKANRILCVLEISRRMYNSFYNPSPLLDNEEKIVNFIKPRIFSSRQEILYLLFLSNSLHLKGIIEFSRGTDNEVHFYMKELMRTVLNGYSSNVILIHNHIEKYPEPSKEDLEITEAIFERCQFFDIRLLDHFLVSRDSYISLGENIRQLERDHSREIVNSY